MARFGPPSWSVCLSWDLILVMALCCAASLPLPVTSSTDMPMMTSQSQESCMARWIQLAIEDSAVNVEVKTAEKLLQILLKVDSKSSVSDLEMNLVQGVFGGDIKPSELIRNCTAPKPSASCQLISPCYNGGRCLLQLTPASTHEFVCECALGFKGQFCSSEAPSCSLETCNNGGTCREADDGPVCLCPVGTTGSRCETEWLTYSVFSDTRLSLLRLTTQQQDLERKLVSLGHDTARQVNEYLQVVSDQAESRLQQTLEIQSDANVNIERRLQRQNATNLAMKKKIMGNSVNIGELQREVQDLRLAYEQKFDSLWRIVNTAGVVEGSPLSSVKVSQHLVISNGGRTAVRNAYNGWGSAVGTLGYSSGRYQWRFRVSSLARNNEEIAVGVTPESHASVSLDTATALFRSYVWFSHHRYLGLAADQLRGAAKISAWQNDDTLTLTLDCERNQMHLYMPRTGEQKTIFMKPEHQGATFYLYLYMYTGNNRLDIL